MLREFSEMVNRGMNVNVINNEAAQSMPSNAAPEQVPAENLSE
jgi:hypothetical protein